MLTVVATIKAKSDHIDEVKAILTSMIEPTHAEEGCIDYVLHQGNDDPSVFVFYENWTSAEALEEHLAKPYIAGALKGPLATMLDGDADIRTMTKVAG